MITKYIRLIRPIAWITFLFPFCGGFGLGMTASVSLFSIVCAFLAYFFWMSFSFTVNAVADKDVDKFHTGKSKDMNLSAQPIVTEEIGVKSAMVLSIVFLVLSVLCANFVHWYFFMLFVILNIIGYVYSMPPFRCKAKPFWDVFCNASAGGLTFIAGVSVGGQNMDVVLFAASFLIAAIYYIPTMVTDYEFDKKAKLTTSAVTVGPRLLISVVNVMTALVVVMGVLLLLFGSVEVRMLAIILVVYMLPFVFVTNKKLDGVRLELHQNWILIPFSILSVGFVVYGFVK